MTIAFTRQLTRDLARHQHAEGAFMELGSKLSEPVAQAPQIFERADAEQRRESQRQSVKWLG